MAKYEKEIAGYTYVSTLWGETIQQFSLRTLGSAELWTDIVSLNDLRAPYIAETAGENVVAYGQMLMVPSSDEHKDFDSDPDNVFGKDILLINGRFDIADGAIKTVGGVKNFTQAVRNRVSVDTKELLYHPDYGCRVREVIGIANAPSASMLAMMFVKASIKSDVRVKAINGVRAEMSGDYMAVDADVTPIAGRPSQSITWEIS